MYAYCACIYVCGCGGVVCVCVCVNVCVCVCRRCELPLAVPNAAVGKGDGSSATVTGGRNHTKWVCQATPRPDSELAGPRRAEEGRVPPTASCRPQVGNCMKMRTG